LTNAVMPIFGVCFGICHRVACHSSSEDLTWIVLQHGAADVFGKRRQSDAPIRRRLQKLDDLTTLSILAVWNAGCEVDANGTSKAGVRTDR
jgi:hypothetical protein